LEHLTRHLLKKRLQTETTEMTTDSAMADEAPVEEVQEPVKEVAQEPEVVKAEQSFHQVLKTKFIGGGPEFMGIVLLCLILGLAIRY